MHTLQSARPTKKQMRQRVDIIAQYLVCIGLFFLPISSSLASCITIGAILALFGESIRDNGKQLLKSPVFYPTLVLILVLFIGTFYNSYDAHMAFHAFKKYAHKLLCFLLLIPLFHNEKARRQLINTLMLSAGVFSIWASLQHYHIIRFDLIMHKKHYEIISEIPFSLYCAFALFFIQQRLLVDKKNYVGYLAIFSLILLQLLFVNLERTGLIITALLILYGISSRMLAQRNKIFILLVTISLVGGSLLLPQVSRRYREVVSEAQGYFQGKHHSSIGLRMAFAVNSLKLIKQKPLLGHGTGSFPNAYETTRGAKLPGVKTLGDPHQSYLHIAVQLGLVGLAVFLIWLLSQWLAANKLPNQEKLILRGLIMAFMLSCLSVSGFYRSRISTLYLTLAAAILGSTQRTFKQR